MSSGFITEAEIEEQRKKRQEEWERVRQPDQPLEAPEEEHDKRTLFERLDEQRKKKEFEYEETHRLKNMIKGLDDDEIEFLDMVDRTKMAQEKRLQNEEAKELEQFRSKKAKLKEESFAKKIEEDISPIFSVINEPLPTGPVTPHNKVLASIVKKRAASEKLPVPPAKRTADDISSSSEVDKKIMVANDSLKSSKENSEGTSNPKSNDISNVMLNNCSGENGVIKELMVYPSAMQCVGILPGIGSYISDDSSDSENTSGSELEDNVFDLRGQKLQKNLKSA